MMNLTKTLTLTTAALLISALLGLWLASTSPANSGSEQATPSMSVDVRLGVAELSVCAGQAWPHFTDGCAAWIAASNNGQSVDRAISIASHDVEHGFTVVSKAQPIELAAN